MASITCVDARGKEYIFEEHEFVERPAVYGILRQQNTVLLTKDKWSKKWGIPGGGIDKKETPQQALKREFLEETGLIISDKMEHLLSDITYFKPDGFAYPWKSLRTVYFVEQESGILRTTGTPDEILEVSFFPTKQAIDLLRQTKNNNAIAKFLTLHV